MKNKYLLLVFFISSGIYSQNISMAGSVGYSLAHGDWFYRSGAGFNVQLDAMYHINQFSAIADKDRLAVGLDWDHSFVAGSNKLDGLTYGRSGIGMLGLKLYYKFDYKFDNGEITPFVSLITGLSYFSSGDLKDLQGEKLLVESKNTYDLGLKLQSGVYIYEGLSVSLSWNVIRDRELDLGTLGIRKFGAGVVILSVGYRADITPLIGKIQKMIK